MEGNAVKSQADNWDFLHLITFSDVEHPFCEDQKSIDDCEYIPVGAMPNEKLPHFLPSLDLEIDVEVVSVQSPSCFYIQFLKEKDNFNKFCQKMNRHYCKLGSNPISPVLELPLDSHWCVDYQDCWLRAKVTKNMGKQYSKENKLKKMQFEMLFVDYGFRDLVDLDSINSLDEDFLHNPPFSILCCLAQVFPQLVWNKRPWSEDAVRHFHSYFLDTNECKITILKRNLANVFEVVLELLNGIVVNEDLVERGYAISSVIRTIMNGNVDESTCQHSETEIIDDRIEETWNPMLEDFLDERNTVFHDDTCAETVVLGVQNKDESKLCKFFSKGLKCPRGEACKWPHILASTDGLPTDFEIAYYKLDSELRLPEEGTVLNASVVAVFAPNNFYINIRGLGHDGTTDLMTELQRDLAEAYGTSNHVRETSIPAIGELMVVYNKVGPIVGFHRVRVLMVIDGEKSNLVEVFYIDLGVVEKVPEKSLRKLSCQFLRPPAQAVKCYLEDVTPIGKTWKKSDPATSFLKKVTYGKTLAVMIAMINEYEDTIGLIILDPEEEGMTVNERIASAGFGVLQQPN